MKRQLLMWNALILFTMVSRDLYADNFNVDGIYYSIGENNTVYVVRGEERYSGDVVIPDKVTYTGITYSVTNIGMEAFDACTSLTSITIPNSISSIDIGAFAGCTSLSSVHITDLKAWCEIKFAIDLGSNPLRYAHHLFLNGIEVTDLKIPNSVKSIGEMAFFRCSGLTSVTIPNSVKSIGEMAFSGCSGLTFVSIPNSMTFIDKSAFSGCSGLTSVSIPNSMTFIGEMAFSGCSGLTSINVESGNPKYDSRDNCNAIIDNNNQLIVGCKNTIIPNSVTSIGSYAFYGCSSLTSVTIPNNVTSIGRGAFSGTEWYNNQPNGLVYAGKIAYQFKGEMPANMSVSIKDGTLGITAYAFRGCSGLTSVTIPNSVTSIGESAFSGCSGLTSINVESGNPKYDSRDNCNAIIDNNNQLIVGCKNTIIPNSVTSIGSSAFYGCSGLTSVTIPNSVTSIGSNAFYGCSNLTSVTIPNSVTSIGGSAFCGCSGLTSVIIPNSVISIGRSAFSDCSGLTSVTLSNSLTSIEGSVFSGCSSLTFVTIPNSVTSIGSFAFKGCSGLTSVTIPNSVASIGYDAFFGTEWYNNQPNGLVYAGQVVYKFKGEMPANMSAVIKEGTSGIADYAFYNCIGLTSVTIPNSVTSIGFSAFNGCI